MKNWLLNKQVNWDYLQQYDWISAMQQCEQDAIWHAEGNVYIHTQMVVEALTQLPEFATLSDEAQTILLYSALLHDVAKPQCTFEEKGRIVSPKHAKVGEKVCRDMLWDMDFETREQICALVRLHGLPLWALEKGNPNQTVMGSSLSVCNEWIYLLAKADVLGRICEDQAELLDRTEYFKALCIENECFSAPKSFHNAHSQFKFFHQEEAYPSTIYDDTAFKIIILSGMPGSGKDTYAASLDLPSVSLDDIRQTLKIKPDDKDGQGKVIQEAYRQAKAYAGKKQSFVWNSTNLTQELRSKLISTLMPYNPYFKIVYFETSRQTVAKHRRDTIPKAALEKMYRNLDMPLRTEVHEVEYRYRK